MTRPKDTEPVNPLPPAAASPPPPAETPRARKLVHHLPRAGLVIFLILLLVICRPVLQPFVLAIFCSYLIHPVVTRIERIPFGKRRAPRWVAVISVYALLFTFGWYGIPPLLGNFAAQFRKLASDVPGHFQWLQQQRKDFDHWVAGKLEVNHLDFAEIDEDVALLATGTLLPLPETDGAPFLAPPAPPADPTHPAAGAPAAAPTPTVVQVFAINVTLPDGTRRTLGTPPIGPAGAPPDAAPGSPESHGAGAAEAGPDEIAAPAPPSPTRRFDETREAEFCRELHEAINAELRRPGPAKGVPARIEREFVPELARRHLELTDADAGVRTLARNTSIRVALALKQEDYAATIDGYVLAGVETARKWVQEQLAGLTGLVTGLAYGIFDFFMVLMLTAFFICFFPTIRDYLRDLVAPQYREHYGIILKRIDSRLSGAIRGQVIICLVNATLTFPGLWLIGEHTKATNLASYAVLLSAVAGVLSMIPIFGVILSTVPMVLLALAQGSPGAALLVIGWISVIHAIEAYLLNPHILGHSAHMNPILVVLALLAGKHFGGLVGALLAVPVASVVVSLFGYYRRLVAERSANETGVPDTAEPWQD